MRRLEKKDLKNLKLDLGLLFKEMVFLEVQNKKETH